MTTLNVLFLCTHNSARSILAEALLNHIGTGASGVYFQAYSAGSSPRDNQAPHPLGLEVLKSVGVDTSYLHSKSWDTFATPDAPHMDLVITVCDNAAGEVCPYWPGQPATAHWGYDDPSATEGNRADQLEAFLLTMYLLQARLQKLVDMPAEKLRPENLVQTAHELSKV